MTGLLAAAPWSGGAGQIASGVFADGKPYISIGGVIAPGDEATFSVLAGRTPSSIVVVSGPGGAIFPAIAIGRDIHERAMTTSVLQGTSCASACAIIWLGGNERLLGANGRVGLHAISVVHANQTGAETHEIDYVLREYLTQMGYTEDTAATIVNTPASGVRWMDALELNANGIATTATP